jgi:dCTP deaminase
MILSAQSIRKRGIISPFSERAEAYGMTYGLGPAGYDIRVAETVKLSGNGSVQLCSTIERFTMPDDVLGVVHDKSTLARQGLFVQNTVIEPGWSGYLTLELTCNFYSYDIYLLAGMPIAQVVFHKLDEPTERPYEGKYQNQLAGPQPAKFYAKRLLQKSNQGDQK